MQPLSPGAERPSHEAESGAEGPGTSDRRSGDTSASAGAIDSTGHITGDDTREGTSEGTSDGSGNGTSVGTSVGSGGGTTTRPAAARTARTPARPSTRTRSPKPAAASKPLSAFVLHQYNWSESSLIVELFTREQGRVAVVARGAKRPTSNFRALILPFAPLHLLLGKAPADDSAEVMPLRSVEWTGGAPLMPAAGLLSGFYLNELLLKLLARQDPHPALFDAYAFTLAGLALAPDDSAVLRAFELRLLRELGVLPELSQVTLTAQDLRAGERYAVDPEHGLQPDAQGVPAATWLAAEQALAAGDMAALRLACSGSGVAAGLRGPLRQLLHYHLGQRPLRTRQVLQGLQRLAEGPDKAGALQAPGRPARLRS